MPRTSFEDMTCSVAQCLDVVGEWWSLLIVRDAFMGVTRFLKPRCRTRAEAVWRLAGLGTLPG